MTAYCIPIHVPIYTDGTRCFVISEWARALALLRDSFNGAFDRFILVAPARPVSGADLVLEPIGVDDGFDPRPSLPADISKRAYWLGGGRRRWRQDVSRALDEVDIAHTAIGDLYRPFSLDALRLAQKRGLPHVFFIDTDIVVQMRNLIEAGLIRPGPDRALYVRAYERALRRIVAGADVSFLKGQALIKRYGGYARNAKLFQDTSYQSGEVVGEAAVETRLASREAGVLRLVYAGRLVGRKGCDQAIDIVAKARDEGSDVTLDLIGDGEDRAALEAQAARLGQGAAIRFLGEQPYGPDLLQALAAYDGLLFTPLSEDTPRMIFDGYAAGLPLLGYDIPYVRERAAEEQATVLLPSGDIAGAADELVRLAADSGRLAHLARTALRAGYDNASDVWYRRRAAWTLEALDRARGA